MDLEEWINLVGKHDDKYQQVKGNLHQGGDDEGYHLTNESLIRFKNRIYA